MAQTTGEKIDIIDSGYTFDPDSADEELRLEDPEAYYEGLSSKEAHEAELAKAAKRRLTKV